MAKTKKAAHSKKIVIAKEQLIAILKRLESGQTAGLIAESKKLGFNGSKQVHKALTELLGGKTKYNAMLVRAQKARVEKNQNEKKAPVRKAPVRKAPVKKAEPVKAEPVKAEPVKAEPVKAT